MEMSLKKVVEFIRNGDMEKAQSEFYDFEYEFDPEGSEDSEDSESVDLYDNITDLESVFDLITDESFLIEILEFIAKTNYYEIMDSVNTTQIINCIDKNDIHRLEILLFYLYRDKEIYEPCPLYHAMKNNNLEATMLLEKYIPGIVQDEFEMAVSVAGLEIVKYYVNNVYTRRDDFDPKSKRCLEYAQKNKHQEVYHYLKNLS